jgi:hypothetical protein
MLAQAAAMIARRGGGDWREGGARVRVVACNTGGPAQPGHIIDRSAQKRRALRALVRGDAECS